MSEKVFSLSELEVSKEVYEKIKRYQDVFASMPPEKVTIIRMMAGSWGCWKLALMAYQSIIDETIKSEENRILTVGMWANSCLTKIKLIKEHLNKTLEETLQIMDETSKWLEPRTGDTLPTPTDKNGKMCRKTATEMYSDMVRYSKARSEFMDAMKRKQEEEINKRKG